MSIRESIRIAWLALIAAACLPVRGVDHFAAGNRSFAHRQYAEALEHYRRVEAAEPGYQQAQFAIGASLWRLGDQGAGLAQMLNARRLDVEVFEKKKPMLRDLSLAFGEKAVQWSLSLGGTVRELYSAGPLLVAVTDKGVLTGIDPQGPRVLWELPLVTRLEQAEHLPVIDGQRVYALQKSGSNVALVSVDLKTGGIEWRQEPVGSYNYTSVAMGPGVLFVGGKEKAVIAFDKATGKELWRSTIGDEAGRMVSAGAHVCTLTRGDRVVCLDASTGKEVWRHESAMRAQKSRLVAHGDVLYVAADRALYALHIGGTPALKWKQVFDSLVGAPTVLDDGKTVAVITMSGLIGLAADTGAQTFATPKPAIASPRDAQAYQVDASGDALLLADSQSIYRLRRDGGIEWAASFEKGRVRMTPVRAAGDVLATGIDDRVIAIAPAVW